MKPTIARFAVAAALAALHATAPAQPPGDTVLRGAQVTEDRMIELLAIDEPAAPADAQRRGFAPAAPHDARGHAAGPGRAALLITFATDSAELVGESRRAIDTVARALQSDRLAGYAFRVEGHADPRGSAERNDRLSQQRAEAVVAYLVSRHGILPERLTARGKGSTEPLVPARPEAPENRRVTIVTER